MIQPYPPKHKADTLVVCINVSHMRKIQEAFKMPADYGYGMPDVTGRWYKRIIFFWSPTLSEVDHEKCTRYVYDNLVAHLHSSGSLVII